MVVVVLFIGLRQRCVGGGGGGDGDNDNINDDDDDDGGGGGGGGEHLVTSIGRATTRGGHEDEHQQ